jgi:CDP-glucose 4,6-dehydratase
VQIDLDFWRGRRVLLTGHTGFKGAWLAIWLAQIGARIHGLALEPPTDPSLFAEARVAELLEHRIGDVRDERDVREAFAAAAPDVVIHMAAQPLVRHSFAEPAATFDVNVRGTVNVLEAVRRHGTPAALVVTSDKVYSLAGPPRALREGDPLGGADPYSASKAAAEIVTAGYRGAFDLPVATARAGNVLGGGDWSADRLLADAARAALANAAIVVRNPGAVRPWQHVLAPLAGYLMISERLAAGLPCDPALNLGPADGELTVRAVLERVAALWGGRLTVEEQPEPAGREAPYLALDSSRARELLGWRVPWDTDRSLVETVAWYRGRETGDDPRALCDAQVEAFGAEAARQPGG